MRDDARSMILGRALVRERGGLLALGVLVGLGAGVGAVMFRDLVYGITWLVAGRTEYGQNGRVSSVHLPWLGPVFLVAVPVLGGLLYGPLISRFAEEARGHGVPEVMLAVRRRGARIRPRVVGVKAIASALCIGTGGSVGREGPIVQIGSALGSTVGQLLGLPDARRKLLVACGAAAGISATFNAPVAGVFFSIELILADVDVDALGALLLASVTADVIGRGVFGASPFLTLPGFDMRTPWEYGLCAGLGVLAAITGVLFSRALYALEDLADRWWHGPESLRPAAGGLLLGAVLLALPQMYGVGYPVIRDAIDGRYVAWMLLLLLGAKILATSLTMAIGGSGGVFAPSLFMGAALGSAYGAVASGLAPGASGPPGAYGVVGMAAVFAAAGRAPVTAVVIIFELTGDYRMVLPLMSAVALATAVAGVLDHDSIYSRKLRRRGVHFGADSDDQALRVPVGRAMREAPAAVEWPVSVEVALGHLAAGGRGMLPVTEAGGRLVGVVTAASFDGALDALESGTDAVRVQRVDALHSDATLGDAVRAFEFDGVDELPVVDDGDRLIGWLTEADVLRARGRRSMESSGQTGRQPSEAAAPAAGSLHG